MFKNVSMSSLSTLRLSGNCKLAEVTSESELKDVIQYCESKSESYYLIGRGSNLVLSPELNYLKIKFPIEDIVVCHGEVYLPANYPISRMTAFAVQNNISGWNVFTGVPATLGGAIYMNAGTSKGEIASLVNSVKVLKENMDIVNIEVTESDFSYRKNHFLGPKDIILGARLTAVKGNEDVSSEIKKYQMLRKSSQPLATKNCGCVYKNPTSNLKAGQCNDLLGLKGFCSSGFRVSHKHANFIEHNGESSKDDFVRFIEVQKRLLESTFHTKFELEVKIT